jgi:hypothetical protein
LRRPRCIAPAVALVPARKLEQTLERIRARVDFAVRVAETSEAIRHRDQIEIGGIGVVQFGPGERRRNARIRCARQISIIPTSFASISIPSPAWHGRKCAKWRASCR